MNWHIGIAALFFVLGAFFAVSGHIGMLFSPGVYTRLQTSSTCSTTAVVSIFIGTMVVTGISPFTGKILAITVFFLITNPVATHIIARFAWENGTVPWRKPK
jgi:multicomponent Na+:H+ antiporter subunit G